jgi:hypothetical protein
MEKMYVGKEAVVVDYINRAKGEVCKEFEKVCMTETSFKRMKKEMHDIFDRLAKELNELK